jgi:hypothetical protein
MLMKVDRNRLDLEQHSGDRDQWHVTYQHSCGCSTAALLQQPVKDMAATVTTNAASILASEAI